MDENNIVCYFGNSYSDSMCKLSQIIFHRPLLYFFVGAFDDVPVL